MPSNGETLNGREQFAALGVLASGHSYPEGEIDPKARLTRRQDWDVVRNK